MAQPRVVRARGVSKYYADVVALDRVDLEIVAGQVHGLAGPNGAGKTTLLGLLLGLAGADQGELEVNGQPLGRRPRVPAGVAGFVDGPGLYPSLTARRNLTAQLRLSRRGRVSATEVDRALDEVGLTDVADDRVRGFSLGMRQRLGVAAALLSRPRLLVLDEPSNGLDPVGRRDLRAVLAGLAADGVAVVVSSHRMDDLAALCSQVTILDRGRAVFTGDLAELATGAGELDYRVRVTDPRAARDTARTVPGLTLAPAGGSAVSPDDELVVRASVEAIDELVARLARAHVGLRELTPVVSALERAYLTLTEGSDADLTSATDAAVPPVPEAVAPTVRTSTPVPDGALR